MTMGICSCSGNLPQHSNRQLIRLICIKLTHKLCRYAKSNNGTIMKLMELLVNAEALMQGRHQIDNDDW